MSIFNDYLRVGAKYSVYLDEQTRYAIYMKFGCEMIES